MECANVTRIPTFPSAKRFTPPPPDEHALYKDNFATGNGELSKVVADMAQRDGNVFFVFHDTNTKYKSLRCELPIRNKCSVFEETSSCHF